jgi:hypothetical protein
MIDEISILNSTSYSLTIRMKKTDGSDALKLLEMNNMEFKQKVIKCYLVVNTQKILDNLKTRCRWCIRKAYLIIRSFEFSIILTNLFELIRSSYQIV